MTPASSAATERPRPTALKLYEATDALAIVRDWIDEHQDELLAAGGDLDALPELAALLDSAEGAFAEKAERVALYIRELFSTAESVKIEAQRLTARYRSMERAAEGLKGYLKREMDRAGIPSIKGTYVTLRVQKSPPAVRSTLTDQELCKRFGSGAEYIVEVPATYRANTGILLSYYKDGLELPAGVTVEQGTHLRIV